MINMGNADKVSHPPHLSQNWRDRVASKVGTSGIVEISLTNSADAYLVSVTCVMIYLKQTIQLWQGQLVERFWPR